jgi:hypothetical protein
MVTDMGDSRRKPLGGRVTPGKKGPNFGQTTVWHESSIDK